MSIAAAFLPLDTDRACFTFDKMIATHSVAREAAISLLRRGLVTPSEAARLAGVSRQLVRHWLRSEGIDWRRIRLAILMREWRKEENRGRSKLGQGTGERFEEPRPA
jgi:hypothetical protein